MHYDQLLSTFCLVVLIGVIAAIGGVWIVATTVVIIHYRGRKKGLEPYFVNTYDPKQLYPGACMYILFVTIASVLCPINIAHEFGGLFISL